MNRLIERIAALLVALAMTMTLGSAAEAKPQPKPTKGQSAAPTVIGHRGASGYRPEHTLAAYQLAIEQGADYIEPDLVPTKDGLLVARHESNITGTTNVASHPEFADRKVSKVIDGVAQTGWFTEDFTLAELKTLRAIERLPKVRPSNTAYDGRFEVPTLDEVLAFANDQSRRTGRKIGVYPETKHPTYFESIGLPFDEPLLSSLAKYKRNKKNSKVIIQSFETTNLKRLRPLTKVALAQLIDGAGAPADLVAAGDRRTYRDLTTAAGLREIATYADGIGIHKNWVLPVNAAGFISAPSAVVSDAHAVGLVVHIWTLRRENQFMAKNFRIGTDPNVVGDMVAEAKAFFDAGIDGAFSDNPDLLVQARDEWLAARPRKHRPAKVA